MAHLNLTTRSTACMRGGLGKTCAQPTPDPILHPGGLFRKPPLFSAWSAAAVHAAQWRGFRNPRSGLQHSRSRSDRACHSPPGPRRPTRSSSGDLPQQRLRRFAGRTGSHQKNRQTCQSRFTVPASITLNCCTGDGTVRHSAGRPRRAPATTRLSPGRISERNQPLDRTLGGVLASGIISAQARPRQSPAGAIAADAVTEARLRPCEQAQVSSLQYARAVQATGLNARRQPRQLPLWPISFTPADCLSFSDCQSAV